LRVDHLNVTSPHPDAELVASYERLA